MPLSAFFGEGDKKNTFASMSKDHTRQVPEEKPWLRGRRGLATIFFFLYAKQHNVIRLVKGNLALDDFYFRLPSSET